MGYAEKRGNTWRARWRSPSGVLESEPGFPTRRAAENYADDQEAKIRAGTYLDKRAGQITLTEWVNLWWPAQDLEPSTLADYRNRIEVRILPAFGDRVLASITAEEVAVWEKGLVARGYAKRTAQAARSLLATILGDAIPHYIQTNPALRRRGRGRIGLRRIEERQRAEKTWASPLDALLLAERCAALSGQGSDFVMLVAAAYTGMRWSEFRGLSPGCNPRRDPRHPPEAIRAGRPVLPRATEGRLRAHHRPPTVPLLTPHWPSEDRAQDPLHLPSDPATLVRRHHGIRLARATRRTPPTIQLHPQNPQTRRGRNLPGSRCQTDQASPCRCNASTRHSPATLAGSRPRATVADPSRAGATACA